MRLIFILLLACSFQVYASDIIISLRDKRCHAIVAETEYQCSMGKYGLTDKKEESNGYTPVGKFQVKEILVRRDRIMANKLKFVSLPVSNIKPEDTLYLENSDSNNIVLVLKDCPINVHVASKRYAGTNGGVAFAETDLMKILMQLDQESSLLVSG